MQNTFGTFYITFTQPFQTCLSDARFARLPDIFFILSEFLNCAWLLIKLRKNAFIAFLFTLRVEKRTHDARCQCSFSKKIFGAVLK